MAFDAENGIVFVDPETGDPIRPSGELRATGRIPLLVDKQWRTGLLLNSADSNEDAWAIYRDDREPSRTSYRKWSNRYPSGSPALNSMPKANRAVPWGDFLVLGDIVWKEDPSQAFSPNNAARYPHGLWYSEPGVMDSWDELDVEFVGQRDGLNRILGMFPLESGLLVASPSSVFLLRGAPDDHLYEDLRVGVGPKCSCSIAFWPLAGVVVWLDARGQVWQTNGEAFGRLDFPLPSYEYNATPMEGDGLGVLDEYLIVSRAGRTFALRLLTEGNAAWTELNVPYASGFETYRGSLYMRTQSGVLRLAPEVQSLRGTFDGAPLDSEVVTRTLAGENPHESTFWHRFGLRSSGGELLQVESIAGPSDSGLKLVYNNPEGAGDRGMAVWPAHGPSEEATFAVKGRGDITYEQVSAWVHKGAGSR